MTTGHQHLAAFQAITKFKGEGAARVLAEFHKIFPEGVPPYLMRIVEEEFRPTLIPHQRSFLQDFRAALAWFLTGAFCALIIRLIIGVLT